MEQNREIERLLGLYFEGRTSLKEEHRLKEYFAAHDAPPNRAYEKAMFALWESAAKERCPAECSDAVSSLCAPESPAGRERSRSAQRSKWLFAAAAAALLAVIAYLIPVNGSREIYCYLNGQPVTDVETARGQALMAARLLNEGIAATAGPFKAFAEIEQTLYAASEPASAAATETSADNSAPAGE